MHSRLDRIRTDVNVAYDHARDTLALLLQRDDELEKLVSRSEDLSAATHKLNKRATLLNARYLSRRVFVAFALICVCTLVYFYRVYFIEKNDHSR